MSSRDDVLARIRKHQPAAVGLVEVPAFGQAGIADGVAHLEAFKAGLERMGGAYVEIAAGEDMTARIRSLFPEAAVVCSAAREVAGNRALDSVRAPRDLHDVDVGVVRAAFGVAETGSLLVTDRHFGISALGFLSQHLVVLLDPARIVVNMHAAYREAVVRDAAYAVFMTGPSATADIEGILIHGAQGIRSLTVFGLADSRVS